MNIQKPIDASTEDSLYERDFVRWLDEQAAALARRDASALDWENLTEEIESLGRSDRRALRNRLETLITHHLKLATSNVSEPRAGWRRTIRKQRRAIQHLLEDSPSLHGYMREVFKPAMRNARQDAFDALMDYESQNEESYRAQIDMLFESMTLDEILEDGFYPNPPQAQR